METNHAGVYTKIKNTFSIFKDDSQDVMSIMSEFAQSGFGNKLTFCEGVDGDDLFVIQTKVIKVVELTQSMLDEGWEVVEVGDDSIAFTD